MSNITQLFSQPSSQPSSEPSSELKQSLVFPAKEDRRSGISELDLESFREEDLRKDSLTSSGSEPKSPRWSLDSLSKVKRISRRDKWFVLKTAKSEYHASCCFSLFS